ncbi:GGDEF domain-containing protein [Noviherbaspirillum agri]
MFISITKQRAIFLGFLGVALVGAMDSLVGFEVSLFVLHIIPVLFVTWFASYRWGVFFAVLITAFTGLAMTYLAPPVANPLYRYLDLGSDFTATLLLIYMQSQLRSSYEFITHQARSDALTGCLNKRGFVEQLDAEIERSRRYQHAFAIVYLDCDNFKTVNDTLGHHVGDQLLAAIGRVAGAQLRAVDAVGRLGGDEFAVLLRETDDDAALRAAEYMKDALDAEMCRHAWPVGFSIGIASFRMPPENAAKALELADALMYEVKRCGKDAIRMQQY